MKKIIPFLPVFALVLILVPALAGAQFTSTQTFASGIDDVTGALKVISKIATWFLSIVVAVAVIMFVYAGFLYLTSGGDDEKVKTAKNYLLYGVIGIAVALLAAALVQVVMYLARNTQSG